MAEEKKSLWIKQITPEWVSQMDAMEANKDRYITCLRDTDDGFIDECQRDRELTKAFLKSNSELLQDNRRLQSERDEARRELVRLRRDIRDRLDDSDLNSTY